MTPWQSPTHFAEHSAPSANKVKYSPLKILLWIAYGPILLMVAMGSVGAVFSEVMHGNPVAVAVILLGILLVVWYNSPNKS